MRKQVIRTILLSASLCASGFTQRPGIFGGAPFVHLESSYNAVDSTAALTRNFEGTWKNTTEPNKALVEGPVNSCASTGSVLLGIVAWVHGKHEVPLWQLPDSQALFFVSGMTIDADGAPNAYNPEDTGLDELANAGAPAHWSGIITDGDGSPLIQQEQDPFPGYYISCTSLSDQTKKFTDPTGYVDASKVPYVVLPQDVGDRGGVRLGDFAVVMNLRNGKSSFAIYGDIGTLGEGSIALADALGISSDARHGGESDGILYVLFPGSGNLQPRTIGEIQSEGRKLLYRSGGMKKLSSCVESNDPDVDSGEF